LKHLSVRFVLALAFIFSLALHYVGSAYAQSNVSVEVDPAFDGSYSSLWGVAPVRLRVSNQGQSFVGRVELIVSQSAGNLVYTTEMDLPQGSSKEVVFYPSMIGTSVTLRARVLNGTQTLAEASAQASSLGSSQYLVGVIVPSADSYLRLENRQLGDINVVQIEPRDLPDRSLALGSLDALVLDGSVATDLSPQQVEALRSWVNSGGTLLLVGELSALGDVMPVRLKGGSTSADVEDLASLSRTSTSPGRAQVLAADLVSGARVIAGSASTPLVAERSFGEGRAIWLAWNPTEEPFSTWQGTPRILARLLASSPHKANDALFLSSWEINQFVQNIPGLGLPSTWALIGFLGGLRGVDRPRALLPAQTHRQEGTSLGTHPRDLSRLLRGGLRRWIGHPRSRDHDKVPGGRAGKCWFQIRAGNAQFRHIQSRQEELRHSPGLEPAAHVAGCGRKQSGHLG